MQIPPQMTHITKKDANSHQLGELVEAARNEQFQNASFSLASTPVNGERECFESYLDCSVMNGWFKASSGLIRWRGSYANIWKIKSTKSS